MQTNNILNTTRSSKKPYFKDNEFIPTKENYNAYSKHGAYGYLEEGGIEKIFENSKFYSEVWSRVRHFTAFPKDFLNFRLQGKVRIHALVNNKGELIEDFTKVSSENPLLELYSMAILSTALSKPLNQSFWIKDKQIPMVFEFNYNLVPTKMDEILNREDTGSYNANLMTFTTTRFVHPEVIQALKNFYEDYFPPVIIMPGGVVMVDPILLYQRYTHWKKHGFKTQSSVRKLENQNLRKLVLVALKRPSIELVERLKLGSLKNKSDLDLSEQILNSVIQNEVTDPNLQL